MELVVWTRCPQLVQRVSSVRGSGPVQLDVVDEKAIDSRNRPLDHPQPVRSRRYRLLGLVRRVARGDEFDALESKLVSRRLRDDQVADMRWIKRSAQQTHSRQRQ